MSVSVLSGALVTRPACQSRVGLGVSLRHTALSLTPSEREQ